ncbi:Flagellar basal body-associated protein FliL [Cognatiyoonia koreensis]|uniref:Flagellar basal body-associated protein FliL n=1 Tax=Cognatiyoonia koreensis TaxID=364200 RepID=A0A1I0RKF3_9RHOB|nr:flagellar basal body-associated FliL family protein [Cognatiyoonia koreensis]SEW41293.1 Flagellar basal body-associated protein FliL [Cognatiyoonia koreensis]
MKKLLLPLLLLLVGTGSGVGAGLLLKEPEQLEDHAANPCGDPADMAATPPPDPIPLDTETEYAKLNNQFVVPVVADDRVAAMVVLSLSIEVIAGNKEVIFETEPKLRDAFLQVLFDHANIGGFSGNFTTASNMRILREDLQRAAQSIVGTNALDVLILDIVRQDT